MLFNLNKFGRNINSLNIFQGNKIWSGGQTLLINIPTEYLKNPFDNLHRKLSVSVPW